MAIFFESPPSGSRPLFQNSQIIDIKIAFVLAKKFMQSIEELPVQDRALIPHAISCIFYKDTHFFIDHDHSLITEEERQLAPPEKESNQQWRVSPQRFIYLVTQIFYSLTVGRLPASELKFLPSKILCNLSESNMVLVKEFLIKGLAGEVEKRYQNFCEFSDVMDIIIKRLATQNTKRIVGTTRTKKRGSYMGELKLENFKVPDEIVVKIYAPCHIYIGRKLDIENQRMIKKSVIGTIYEGRFDGTVINYSIIIENDHCISRKHALISLSSDIKKSFIQDLGSTHGVLVFTDSSRDQFSAIVVQDSKVSFISPTNQNFQVGNTLINVSVLLQ